MRKALIAVTLALGTQWATVDFEQVHKVIQERCTVCHSATPIMQTSACTWPSRGGQLSVWLRVALVVHVISKSEARLRGFARFCAGLFQGVTVLYRQHCLKGGGCRPPFRSA